MPDTTLQDKIQTVYEDKLAMNRALTAIENILLDSDNHILPEVQQRIDAAGRQWNTYRQHTRAALLEALLACGITDEKTRFVLLSCI